MRKFFALCSLLCTFAAYPAVHPATPVAKPFGSYTGVLHHARLGKDQLARLDFIAAEEGGFVTQVMAVLSLYFGDFASTEYVSYHFDNVRYNALNRQLVFDQADQPVTLTTTGFGDGKFAGRFRSSLFGEVGTLELELGDKAQPKAPLLTKVWGLYHGNCDIGFHNGETYVQLVTARTAADVTPLGNPFGAYRIVGDVAWQSEICLDNMCTAGRVTQGSYNFFTGDLRLLGTPNLVCKMEGDALLCNPSCRFARVAEKNQPPPVLEFPRARAEFAERAELPALSGEAAKLDGEYVGYLHHERLDTYQVGSLNLASYLVPSPGDPGVSEFHLSAVASLYFGDRESPEALHYAFSDRKLPNPITSPVLVLSKPDTHVDAILQIKELGNGVVRGDWYSLLYGRVGQFEFRKAPQTALTLSGKARRLPSLSASYTSDTFSLNLLVADLGVVPVHPANPFQPLSFGGTWQTDAVPPQTLTGGSYDFYTGALSIERNGNLLVGVRQGENLKLRRYTPSVAPTFFFEDGLDPYQRTKQD